MSLGDEIDELLKAQLAKAKAEFDAAWAEKKRLLEKFIKPHGTLWKEKSGRSSIWKGFPGFCFVLAVEEFRANHEREKGRPIALSRAISWVAKTDPILQKELPRGLTRPELRRELQVRYQEAANRWSKSRRRAAHDDYKAASERASERVEVAFKEWNRLRAILEMRVEARILLRRLSKGDFS